VPLTDSAPIIVTALFGAEDFAWLDGLRRRYFPPERNVVPAHCTLFHHLAPELGAELKQRLSMATRGVRAPLAQIAGVLDLGGGVAFRIESEELAAIRGDLADAFAPMLVPQDRAGWRAHVTVQNKVARAEAKALLEELGTGFERRPLRIAGLASWWYRGGPWEAHSRHMFA
jgi:hypothetical protein